MSEANNDNIKEILALMAALTAASYDLVGILRSLGDKKVSDSALIGSIDAKLDNLIRLVAEIKRVVDQILESQEDSNE